MGQPQGPQPLVSINRFGGALPPPPAKAPYGLPEYFWGWLVAFRNGLHKLLQDPRFCFPLCSTCAYTWPAGICHLPQEIPKSTRLDVTLSAWWHQLHLVSNTRFGDYWQDGHRRPLGNSTEQLPQQWNMVPDRGFHQNLTIEPYNR